MTNVESSELNDLLAFFEKNAGELHDYKFLGKTEYVNSWKFTLQMRNAQGELNNDDHSYLLGLLEDVEKC